MGNNSVPKFIFRLSRFPVYRGSVLGRFYCTNFCVNYTSSSASTTQRRNIKSVNVNCGQSREISLLKVLFVLLVYVRESHKEQNLINKIQALYEGWNFNSGNYLFTTDTK